MALVSPPDVAKPVTGYGINGRRVTGALGVDESSPQGQIGKGTWEALLCGCGHPRGRRGNR